jgi:hypothetical protein
LDAPNKTENSILFIKIGDVKITKSPQAKYTIQTYAGGLVGIRGLVQSESDSKLTEGELYLLREGMIRDVEIQADDGTVLSGSYKINELNWKKERKNDNTYELRFNVGLQRQQQ